MTVIYAAHMFLQEAHDDTPAGLGFTVSAALVAFVLTYLIPLATGLVTRLTAHPFLKYVVTAVLAAVTSIANAAVTNAGVAVISWNTVLLAIATFLGALLQYKALYKPVNMNAKLAPNSGLGGTRAA